MAGEFSHMMYDDITGTLFMYINGVTIQDLCNNPDIEMEECCLHLIPETFDKLKEYVNKFPSKEALP